MSICGTYSKLRQFWFRMDLYNPFNPSFPFKSFSPCDGNSSSGDSSDESAVDDNLNTIEALKKKCKNWQRKCGQLKAVLKETKKKGNAVGNERDHFFAQKKKLYAAYELIRSRNEEVVTLNNYLQHQNEMMQAEIDEKNKMCVDSENVCEQYTKLAIENDCLREYVELMRKESRCAKKSNQLGDQRRILNIKRNLKQELDVCKKKVAKVHKICRDHSKKTKELLKLHEEREQFYEEVSIENEYLIQLNENLSSANEVDNKKYETLREKFDSLVRTKYNESTEIASTMTENDSLRREIETMREELETCVEKIENERRADYDSICEENAKISGENDRLRCRIECLKKELDSCKEEKAIGGYHDTHRDENAKLSKDNAMLRHVNKQIKEELERALENHRIVSKKYNESQTLSVQTTGPSDEVELSEINLRNEDR